jgi:hypothetical protein
MGIKNRNRKSRWTKFVIPVLLIASAVIYFRNAYHFLSISESVAPDILVVEGWLHEDALSQAKKEFSKRNYRLLLTTGFPNDKGYLMGSNGKLVFYMDHRITASKDNIYKITLLVRGTKAKKAYPHFILFADTFLIGDGYSSFFKRTFAYNIICNNPPDSVILKFDNDAVTRYGDRNMFIYSISVNNQVFRTDNENVICYYRKNGEYYLHQQLSPSSAQDAANYLKDSGIPDSLIIPVITTHKIKSRTFTTALDIKEWLRINTPGPKHALTVFSQGPHARRSYILYKKAFGTSADIGIISCPTGSFDSSNWWQTRTGWESILYETAGLIYASIIIW